jgi:hypothetical protein
MGFVQGGESFSFQIKFEPTPQLLQHCKKYLKHRDDLIREIVSAAAVEAGQDAESAAAAAAAADTSSVQWAHIAHEIQVPLQLDVRATARHISSDIRSTNIDFACGNCDMSPRCPSRRRLCFTCCARVCRRLTLVSPLVL